MAQNYNSYFEKFGLNPETLEEQQARRMTGNRAAVMEQAAIMRGFGGEQFGAGYLAGSMLAQTIGDMVAKKKGRLLSQDERKRIAMQADARNRFEQQHNPQMSAEDSKLLFQQISAESAYRAGLPEIGMEMAGALSDDRTALAKRDMELNKLRMSTEQAGRNLDRDELYGDALAEAKADRAVSSNMQPVWRKDPVTGQYEQQPVDAYMAGRNAQIGEDTLVPGQYTTVDPARFQGTSKLHKGAALRDMMTPTQIGAHKTRAKELQRSINAHVGVVKLLGEAKKEMGSVDFMGAAGTMEGFITRSADAINNSLSAAGLPSAKTYIGGQRDETGKLVGGKPMTLDSMITESPEVKASWERLEQTGQYSARYKSKIMQLAYSYARANEPGARQLSDADIANALTIIGGNVGNPEALMKVFSDNIDSQIATVQSDIDFVPEDLHETLYTRKGIEGVNESIARWDAARAGTLEEIDQTPARESGTGLVTSYTEANQPATPAGQPAPVESTVAEPPSTVPMLDDSEIAKQQAEIDDFLLGLEAPE